MDENVVAKRSKMGGKIGGKINSRQQLLSSTTRFPRSKANAS